MIKADDEIMKRNIKEKNDEELIKVLRADLKEMREMMERSKRDVIDMNNANLMLRKKLEYYNANNSDDEVSEGAVSETHTSQSDFENDEEKYNFGEVAHKLLDRYLEMPVNIFRSQAFVHRAEAYISQGKKEEAVEAYKVALNREVEFPNVLTNACFDLPFSRCRKA